MNRKMMLIETMILLVFLGCTSVEVNKIESAPTAEETIPVDITGMNAEQQEVAKGMINEIVSLVKAGKTEAEIIKILQDKESKKITRYRVEAGDSPSRGPEDAKVTIIEFSDYQCPFSKRVQATMDKIMEKYPQGVRHVYKQHPLSFHKDAFLASEASLAAGVQGMFWDMHDIIFENPKKLKKDNLLEYAEEIGLDVDRFKADLEEHVFKAQVDRESQQAVTVGATGTPAFFVNGIYLSGAKPLDSFVKVIDEELSGKKVPFKWGKNVKDGKKKKQRREEDPNKIYTVPLGKSPYKGSKDAPITVVVFQDFQCPFSNRSQATMKQLNETYKEKIKIVFKNFPLNFHKDAVLAAEAALAAGAQGKFWEMHDKIFANQKKLKIDNLKIYAQELNLDLTIFNKDLETHKFKKMIDEDLKTGKGLGVRGTPTFFINGKKLVGAKPLTEFQKVIDGFVKKK